MTRTAVPPTRPPEPDGPRQVSKFEFNLIRILKFLLGHFPADQGLQLVRTSSARPECLSGGAVELVKDALAKASVLYLTRAGGWRNDRYLRDNKPAPGRVWDRIPLEERALSFSRPVLDFLLWLTAEKVHETKQAWDAAPKALSPADELFFCLAFDHMRSDPDVLAVLRKKDAFTRNPFCWIMNPGDVADPESTKPQPPDFAPVFTGQRAVLMECLQRDLEHRWVQSERAKGQIGDWKRMRQQGTAGIRGPAGLPPGGRGGPADGSRPVRAANQRGRSPVRYVTGVLDRRATGERAAAPGRPSGDAAGGSGAAAADGDSGSLAGTRARYVGYFDEDYQASQMWKTDWEAVHGDQVAVRARAAVEMLEPLRGPVGGQPATGAGQAAGENPEGSPG